MKVLVAGSRTVREDQAPQIHYYLDEMRPKITKVVHGGASGADSIGGHWAEINLLPVSRIDADWEQYGKAAGPIRNQRMLDDHPDIEMVLAFVDKPINQSRGTLDMVRRAIEAEIDYEVVRLK